jgi:hypothetical protein
MTKTDSVRSRTQRFESVTFFSGLKKNSDNPPSAKPAVLTFLLCVVEVSYIIQQQEIKPITNPTNNGLFSFF